MNTLEDLFERKWLHSFPSFLLLDCLEIIRHSVAFSVMWTVYKFKFLPNWFLHNKNNYQLLVEIEFIVFNVSSFQWLEALTCNVLCSLVAGSEEKMRVLHHAWLMAPVCDRLSQWVNGWVLFIGVALGPVWSGRGGEQLGVRSQEELGSHFGRKGGVPAALCLFCESRSWWAFLTPHATESLHPVAF